MRIVLLCQAFTDFLVYLLLQLYRLRDKFPNTSSRLQTTASLFNISSRNNISSECLT
ncbi:hypothetical protein GW17_00043642 [Ensete ventricosum]|nr:hypothetical protein GW17_00043642 [Ensete ventricosum]